jgi:hypothetical protein
VHTTLECTKTGISWKIFTKAIHVNLMDLQYNTNILSKAMIPFEFYMSPKHNNITLQILFKIGNYFMEKY